MGRGSDLSNDDILCIMSYLPFSGLIRARAVCKVWKELAKLTESKVPLSSWCILSCPAKIPSETLSGRSGSFGEAFRNGLGRSGSSRRSSPDCVDNFHVVMFDPSIRKWLKVKNEFGCASPFASSTRELLWVPSTGGYSGLVCVFEWEEESRSKNNTYWVGNPITGVWKCIVGPSPWRGVHQLVVNRNLSYKIISIRWERLIPAVVPTGVWRVAIYDSEEDKWRKGAHFSVPEPPRGVPYTLSSRTHTASDKMMYLLMHRAGKYPNWETYAEIQIVGYDIARDSFQFVTPLSSFDLCFEYFEPTSCRDWPVHLVLKSDQLILTNSRQVRTITQSSSTPPDPVADLSPNVAADPSECPILVTCSTREVPRRKRWYRNKIFQVLMNVVKGRPPGFHKILGSVVRLRAIPSKKCVYPSGVSCTCTGALYVDPKIKPSVEDCKEFENKICILEFNEETRSWDATEEKTFKVTGKFYSKDRVFHCAGERLQHLYCAHLDEHQSVVVYNAKKDDFSTWSTLPPLGGEYGGCIAKNYHSLGSFVPRLDADPYYNTKRETEVMTPTNDSHCCFEKGESLMP